MRQIVEEDKKGRAQLPGGMTHAEKIAAEQRRQAGLTDAPGAQEIWVAAMRAQREAERRRVNLGGYVPAYPWSSH